VTPVSTAPAGAGAGPWSTRLGLITVLIVTGTSGLAARRFFREPKSLEAAAYLRGDILL